MSSAAQIIRQGYASVHDPAALAARVWGATGVVLELYDDPAEAVHWLRMHLAAAEARRNELSRETHDHARPCDD